MSDDSRQLTETQKQGLRNLLPEPTPAPLVEHLFRTCEDYLSVKLVHAWHPQTQAELKRFMSRFRILEGKLGYEAHLMLTPALDQFNQHLQRINDLLSRLKGRRPEIPRLLLIAELAGIFEAVFGKAPGKPYYHKAKRVFAGPFLSFVSRALFILDGAEPHNPTLKTAVVQVLSSRHRNI